MKSAELKRLLISQGFQVFRTLGSQVLLADRVRDNLVMDSGVAVQCSKGLAIRVTVRAQASDYPKETEIQLLERARLLMTTSPPQGYVEVETAVVPIADPGEPNRQLDVSYEVTFEKPSIEADSLGAELRVVLSRSRVA